MQTEIAPIEPRTWGQAARHGARLGVRMTLLYALAFVAYAAVRSTIELAALPAPDGGRAGTIAATIVSLIVPAIAIALVLAPLSALAGMCTSLLLHVLLPRTGRGFTIVGTLAVAAVVAFAVADSVQALLLPAAGFKPLDLPFATWAFWFGLPTAIYIAASAFEGRWLRSRSRITTDHREGVRQ